jgi:hypothetical protein
MAPYAHVEPAHAINTVAMRSFFMASSFGG